MQSDWLDQIDWLFVLAGVGIGAFVPAIMTLIIFVAGGTQVNTLILILTELSVFAGSLLAAIRAEEIRGRLLNSLLAAFICATISLIASIIVNPETGGNLAGIIFLMASYGAMGLLGGLLSKPAQQLTSYFP